MEKIQLFFIMFCIMLQERSGAEIAGEEGGNGDSSTDTLKLANQK